MGTIYIDRDGEEWKKNCGYCCHKDSHKIIAGKENTYCEKLRESLNDRAKFYAYYQENPNECDSFSPTSGF